MKLNLSQKIFGIIMIFSALSVVFMLYFGFKSSKQSSIDQTSILMKDKMVNIINQIDSLLAGYITQINIIATDQILQNALVDEDGLNEEELQLLNYRLAALLIYSGPWDSLMVVDAKRIPIAAASIKHGDKIFEIYPEENTLINRSNTERIAYSDSYAKNDKNILSNTAAIKGVVGGKEIIVGYVVGRITLRSIQEILDNSQDSIGLYRDDGILITRNSTENDNIKIENTDILNFSKKSDTYIKSDGGIDYMITMARELGMSGYKGNRWVLASVSDVSSYVKENQKNVNRIIYISALFMIIILMIMIFVINRLVTRPVRKLQSLAVSIASGDFSEKIEIKAQDEIGMLGLALSNMSSQLSNLYNSLEERVSNKTLELQNKLKELATSKKATENALLEIESAESKMLEKNIQIESAFNEVQHFARVADRERLTYSLLISSIGEGVVVVDPEGIITVSNNVCARMFKKSVEELKGVQIFDLLEIISNDKKTITMESLRAILVEGNLFSFKYWAIKRKSDAQEIVVSGVIAPLIDENSGGIVRGMIFTLRNVEEEKLLEEARVGFISTASHQLRTPLTSMRWFVEMLHDGDAGDINDEQKHFLERVSEGIERMIGLVNLLLQIARVEAGRTSIEPVPVDLAEIVNGVAKTIELQLKEHNQNIQVIKNEENVPNIMLDRDYIWQIVQNLLTNAQRYSFDNTTTEVKIIQEGEYIVLSVKDYGIGIPKIAQSRIFEKFYRADNALTKVATGTGLGLALIKMLIEEMGGTLTFESEENVGSTFYLKIPIKGMKAREGDVKLSV